jgi:Domain of unknown function (DUF397)
MGTDPSPSAAWKKSSKSDKENCVEVAMGTTGEPVLVRDSKASSESKSILAFTSATWSSFIQAVKGQAFDL